MLIGRGSGKLVRTTCDMDHGGWTLIGEDGGFSASKYNTWLRKNYNTHLLAEGTEIKVGEHASLDAIDMAVNEASKVSKQGKD